MGEKVMKFKALLVNMTKVFILMGLDALHEFIAASDAALALMMLQCSPSNLFGRLG